MSVLESRELDLVTEPDGNLVVRRRAVGRPPAPVGAGVACFGSVAWYVPYTAVHPETVEGAPPYAVWIDVSCDLDAYHAALQSIWARGEDFAVLEHDIVCRPDVVVAFEECPEPWCVFKRDDYCHPECQEAWSNQLSTTRFRSGLIEAVPDALSSIPADERGWPNLCDRIGERLRAAGFSHHWHEPPVHHHRMGRPR